METMAANTPEKSDKKEGGVPEWIWEVLLIVTVTPALLYALAPLQALPVA
jgi:hypothetical protein